MLRGKKDYRDTGKVIGLNGDPGQNLILLIFICVMTSKRISSFDFLLRFCVHVSIEELNYYDEDECNTFIGTDSTVFPAFLPLDEGCFNFTIKFLQSLQLEYFFLFFCQLLLHSNRRFVDHLV